MVCEFSETQFVVGILTELINNCWKPGKAWTSPRIPTQKKEKEKGYDFTIKGAVRTLFFQFKVPEKKTTKKGKYWEEFKEPYYEFKIWPDSLTHQHNELVDLAKADPRNRVYYCSPGFHTFEEFDKNYTDRTIARKSIYVPCAALPKISGNDKHDISYTFKSKKRIYKMHSQEFEIQAFDIEELKADVENAVPYENIHTCLASIAEIFSIDIKNVESDMEKFDKIADYLLMHKNLNMLLLGEC